MTKDPPAQRSEVDALPLPGVAQLVGFSAGAATAVVGALMLAVGSGSLLPPTDAFRSVPWLLGGLGALAALLGIGADRRQFASLLRRSAPRLYPFAPTGVQLGIFLLLLVALVSVVHATFDIFTSANTGAAADTPAGQQDAGVLLTAASAVIWGLVLYAVFGMRRVIRMGRVLDGHSGRDVYGQPIEALAPDPLDVGRNRPPSGPPASGARSALVAVAFVLAIGMSAGIQTLEVNLGPASAVEWGWAQLLTPLYVAPFAAGVALIDRGIRSLEQEYALSLRSRAATGPMPQGTPGEARFVP